MITKLKKALYISTSVLVVQGVALNCQAETETAASVVGNLLSTAANAVTQGQAKANETLNTTPNIDGSTSTQPSQDAEGENTAGTSDIEPAATSTTPALTSLATPLETPGVASTTTPTSIEQPTPAVATAPASLDATQKRVGFIDSNGNVLIAPEGSVFPNEMLDGQLYFFSRDVDALKRQIAENEQKGITPDPQGGMPNGQMMPDNGGIPGQMQPNGQQAPQSGMPSGQMMPGNRGMSGQTQPNVQPTSQGGMSSGQMTPGNRGMPGQMQPNGQYAPQDGIPNGQMMPDNGGIPGQKQSNVQPTSQGGMPSGQMTPGNRGIPQSEDINKKPIMFQCYLA